MSMIRTWAARHGVTLKAIMELEEMMGLTPYPQGFPSPAAGEPLGSESRQQALVRLEAARMGVRLFRNNSGALKDADGRQVRFGLGNDSAPLNKVLKSPDLVGWRKTRITVDMIGSFMAQTVLREMKPEDWSYSATEHERAQLAFLNLCAADGGDARFCTGPGTL